MCTSMVETYYESMIMKMQQDIILKSNKIEARLCVALDIVLYLLHIYCNFVFL